MFRNRPLKGKLRDQSHDRGMTLLEVMISVTITGMLVAAMATATSVILAQAD